MNQEEYLDKLNRAVVMEEEMAGVLIDLCEPEALPDELPGEMRRRIKGILLSIKEDTLRHKKLVSNIQEGMGS